MESKDNIFSDIVNCSIFAYKKARYAQNLNIDNPKTLNEKIGWIKVYGCTDLKTYCTDKINLHDYCIKKLNKDICVDIIKIYNEIKDFNIEELPESFVLKCNHGCGYNILIKNKMDFKKEYLTQIDLWLHENYAKKTGEMQYYRIQPRCYTEKYLGDNIKDYKIWCFNGQPLFIKVISNRFLDTKYINTYDMNFNFMDIFQNESNINMIDVKPYNFDLMKKYSEILSEDFNFVRVDFYEIDNILYLGELTFTPANAYLKFKDDYDLKYGNMLKL